MSVKALNWVLEHVRTDGPSAQSVLLVLADVANAEGVCRHADPDYIAEKSRQSRATVFRRLDELEHFVGLVRLYEQTAKGKRYEVHLPVTRRGIDYDGKTVEAWRKGKPAISAATDAPGASELESQIETGPESQIETHPVSPVRHPESHSCDSIKSPRDSEEPLPTLPSGGLEADSGKPESEESISPEELAATRADYPIPDNHPQKTAGLFRALDAAEQVKVRRGAFGAKRKREKDPKNTPLPQLWKFIRDGAYKSYQDAAPAAAEPSMAGYPRSVLETTREGLALKVLFRISGMNAGRDTREGVVYWQKKPLTLRELACADAPNWTPKIIDERRSRDQRWMTVFDAAQIAAWREFIKAAIGRAIPFDSGTNGIRVPWPWPPRKDGGTYSATAPPGSLMSEDDERVMAEG